MKKIIRLSLFLSFLLAFASQVCAQTAGKISIQGVLKGATGASVPDGTYMVTFRLYDAITGGNLQWTEAATLNVIAGVYSHYLGSVTPLDMLNFGSTFFLEIQVGTSVMTPRNELPYAPYSLSVAASDSAETVVCSGAVGDVKYSILDPKQFAEENGDCWVPMDGRTLAVNDTLRKKWDVTKVPDAGGLFLRGHEFVGKANNDPNRTAATPPAQVQMDEIKAHDHDVTDPRHRHDYIVEEYDDRTADGDLENTYLRPTSSDSDRETATAKTNITINPRGGAENRPKNLSLYTYIRVN